MGGSGGIGRALTLGLARRGAELVIHGGSSRERLESAVREAELASEELDPRASTTKGHLGLLQAIDRPSDLLSRLPALGRIDILVVSFGPFFRGPLAATGAEDWERLALLDLALPGALVSALMPAMSGRGWGRILLLGGTRTDAIRAYSSNAAYAAAKTALAVLTKSAAAEGAASGVGCLMVCPGFVDTEYLDEAGRAELRSKTPRGQLAQAADLAETALDLLAAEPCLASGAVLTLDGGLRL